jgi:hypothetical protein
MTFTASAVTNAPDVVQLLDALAQARDTLLLGRCSRCPRVC